MDIAKTDQMFASRIYDEVLQAWEADAQSRLFVHSSAALSELDCMCVYG
jgi:hypothetical protein